jgi:hypothetical protein
VVTGRNNTQRKTRFSFVCAKRYFSKKAQISSDGLWELQGSRALNVEPNLVSFFTVRRLRKTRTSAQTAASKFKLGAVNAAHG